MSMQSIKKYFVVRLGCLKYARRRVFAKFTPRYCNFSGTKGDGKYWMENQGFFPNI